MPTTPRFALPYPTLPAVSDVPADIKALADALDLLAINAALVTYPARLPNAATGPRLGDRRVLYIPNGSLAGNAPFSLHWDMVWNPSGWWWMGGFPLTHPSSSTSQTVLAGWQPHPFAKVTLPENGDYMVRASYEAVGGAANGIEYGRIRRTRDNATAPLVADVWVNAGQMAHGVLPWQQFGSCAKGDVLVLDHQMTSTDIASRNALVEAVPIFLSPP